MKITLSEVRRLVRVVVAEASRDPGPTSKQTIKFWMDNKMRVIATQSSRP